jgi:RHS repeat-associated protein
MVRAINQLVHMIKFLLMQRLLLTLFGIICYTASVAQTYIPIRVFACPDAQTSVFIYNAIKADKSDGYCDTGTRMRAPEISGPTSLYESVTITRLDDSGPHRAQIKVVWKPGATGKLTVRVAYDKRIYKGFPSFKCKWSENRYMYTYEIYREWTNPGANITGSTTATVPNNATEAAFNLSYMPTSSYPHITSVYPVDYRAKLIRYYDGKDPNPITYAIGWNATTKAYTPAPITVYKTGQGSTVLNLEVYTELSGGCGKWHLIAPITLNVYSSCYQDDVSGVSITAAPVGPPGEFLYHPEDDTYAVEKDQDYTISVSGITDFSSHFTWQHDGGSDITLTGSIFSVHKDLGSYRIEARPNDEGCPIPNPLQIVIGGRNITIVGDIECAIVLNDILTASPYNKTKDDIVLQHFSANVINKRSVIVNPGITLELGAELFIESDPQDPTTDQTRNFVQQTSYDEYGRVILSNRSYFDERGLPTQSQYKNLTADVILANATLYDAQGRAVISTLSAPIEQVQSSSVTCPNDVQAGDNLEFTYKPDFVKASDGQRYNYTHFDGTNESTPVPLSAEEGTLGWYYSTNNGTSTNQKINEPLIATTQYPYSRTLYHHDGSGEAKTATKPGDTFKAGSPYLGSSDKEPVSETDPYFGTNFNSYLSIKERDLGFARPATIAGEFFRSVSIDPTGKKSVSYIDKSGNAIISLYYGNGSSPITTSYQFYDNAGRMLVSISPNGINQYSVDGNNASNFNEIDKTRYFYNNRGLLAATEEKTAGVETDGISRSEFIYRKDGSIRFSQNELQRNATPQRYSYTNYDRSGRPVESGEYESAGGITFNSPQMLAVLESLDGGLPETGGIKSERNFTYYDEPDPNLPEGRVQRFVHGAVSHTRKENLISTWYSYDEQGRREWMLQDITGLGIKTLDYRFGPTGQVQEMVYQRGNEDQFTHFYEYDADGRLYKVYTTRELLDFNKMGQLTNEYVLEHQATYYYYLHGPLKRVELATQADGTSLQGIDYVYTADGALKSINHADALRDPGGDGTINAAVQPDVFGITLDYYPNDYVGANNQADNLPSSGELEEQYSGLIKATRWHSPIEPNKQFAYGYSYDQRNQFKTAKWGSVIAGVFVPSPWQPYYESVSGYDDNGNISALQRQGNVLQATSDFKHDFVYNYKPNTNLLESITQPNSQTFRTYQYDDLGQMTEEVEDTSSKYIVYDVSGKVTGVYADAAHTQPITTFVYDDRGFRLSKTNYDENYAEVARTWYVRDLSGQVACTYDQDLMLMEPARAREVPVYGSGKLGVYKPDYGLTFYELTDHLGNVRAVIGDTFTEVFLATMETERASKEQEDFQIVKRIPTASFINHTGRFPLEGRTEFIDDPNEVTRINNRPNDIPVPDPIGTGMMRQVHPGDVLHMEVYAKYANFTSSNSNNLLGALAGFLSGSFATAPIIDGASIFNVVNAPEFAALSAMNDLDNSQPRMFLNYLLFDKDFKLTGYRFDQVSAAAEIPITNPDLHEHELLELEVTIEKEGFMYIYVSNESDQNMEAYFDDLRITHAYSNIVAGGDFYPFGLSITDRQVTREDYRYGYQGQYAEKDEETGWNHFELREYDAVIGRWLSRDPEGQNFSQFVGMGNNPVSGTDADGGWVRGAGLWNNLIHSDERIFSEQNAASWSSDWTKYEAAKVGGKWGVLGTDKLLTPMGDWQALRFSSFTEINDDGSLGETSSMTSMVYAGPSPGTAEPFQIEFEAVLLVTTGGAGNAITGAARGLGTGIRFLRFGGPTFSKYRAAYWATRVKPVYQPIRLTSGKVFKITTELHHRFIPNRWKWAPNWLKNNRFNLQPLNTIQHGLKDPYRFNFFPQEIKNAIWSGKISGY